ncbi:peptidylprolyl isomerase [Adlercreutzia muris]|uniref:peptidylprolyl isomerase n=1 Tax=Adlercreutzia muris TaxID=1796610 RepID=UPI0035196E87
MGRIELSVYTPHYVPTGTEIAVIETSKGTVRVELFGREVPVTVGNFVELAAKDFYDNLKFHAKKPGSVVLGGCPTTRSMGPAQVLAAAQGVIRGMHPGTGDARYTIIDEWEGNPRNVHRLGSLCMAHKSAPNSGSCQFYFSLGEQPEFDDQYTVFGQVTEGLEVIENLAIGDAIKTVAIEGADEEALAAAIAQETPRPPTPQEALAAIEAERAERAGARAVAEAEAAE